jgi:hypothetical protein
MSPTVCPYTDEQGINYVIENGVVVGKDIDVRRTATVRMLFGLDPNAYVEDILPVVRSWPEGGTARATRPGGELDVYTIHIDCLRNSVNQDYMFAISFGGNLKMRAIGVTLREKVHPQFWENRGATP